MEYENFVKFVPEIRKREYDNKFIIWVPKESYNNGYTLEWYIDSVHVDFKSAAIRRRYI